MTRLPFEFSVALRYLRPKRTFVSVITLISVVGVTLGVAVLIVVISVMSGFDRQLREKIFGFSAHLRVVPISGPMRNYREVIPAIRKNPLVRGVAPYILGPVIIETQTTGVTRQIAAPFLRGVDRDLEQGVTAIPESIIDGAFDVEGKGLVIGYELARHLNLKVGDNVAIYSQSLLTKLRDAIKAEGERRSVPFPDDYEVRGIFNVGYYEYDSNVIVCSLFDAQDLYGFQDWAHGLFVMLDDPYLAGRVKRQLSEALGPDYRVYTWMEENSSILNALVVEKNMIRFLLFFIVLVAAFGITNSQITFVVQKTREIGMLKALGASGRQIVSVFLGQSFTVGVAGVALGIGLGLLAIRYRNAFLGFMNGVTGFELFPADIYGFARLPAVVDVSDIVIIAGGSLIICALAGVFPALNAGRLRPAEALRHE